ncbi:hypothetical protein FUA23_20160 [Neolewinella aurantiaca]|uniref:O-antigen/teichoic acid export membrane protein n=1 Tax=Neolewinella aurantiaca TaxID=2602767 RepID=A0A5C7FF84_9BACT|nr:hypothetical protein [Neolewinella aurantiaca]TXF85977.1 hypothetical protein FUA23_20160 [Neolewinella aurantiaca]
MMSASLNKKLPLLLEQCLFSGTGFVVNIALAKSMGLELYGVYASLIIISYLLLSISQALVIQPMQIHVGKTTDDSSYRIVLIFLQCFLILVYFTFFFGAYLANTSLLAIGQEDLLPFLLYLAFFLGYDFYRKYFLATAQLITALIIAAAFALSTIGLLAFHLLSTASTDLNTYLYLLAAGQLPSIIIATVVYWRSVALPDLQAIKRYFKIHIIDGQWLLYAAITQWFSGNLYVMASGLLIGLEALGALRFVQSLFGLVNILLQTIENYVLPQLSKAYQVSLQHCYRAFQSALGVYQMIILAGLGVLFLFAGQVLRFAGSAEFVPYAYVLRGMVVLYAIIILAYPVRLLIRVTELNRSYFVAYLISFAFSLISYQFLLTHFGVTGAVIGLIGNQLILQATWLIVLKKNQFNVWKLYIS